MKKSSHVETIPVWIGDGVEIPLRGVVEVLTGVLLIALLEAGF